MGVRSSLFVPVALVLGVAAWPTGCSSSNESTGPSTTSTAESSTSVSSSSSSGTGGAGGMGGMGGAGGSGGMMNAGADKCPGQAVNVDVNVPVVLSGSTTGKSGDYASYCGADMGSGPDVVFAVTPASTGTLTLTLDNSNGLNGVLYAEVACGDSAISNAIACVDAGTGTEKFTMNVEKGTTFYVFVDGRDNTSGDFTLKLNLAPPTCGDGVINPDTEACDDGNTANGDGCNSTCQFEPPADMSDTCPGVVEVVQPNMPLVISGFTTGYTDNYHTCDGAGAVGSGGPDRVFQIEPQANGTLTLSLPNLGRAGGGFDGMLSAWVGPNCDPTNGAMPPYLGCSDGAQPTDTETMTFPVTAGTSYFVVVDGYANYSYGNFQLTVTLTP